MVCLAPGSRSTPLVAAAARHPGIRIVTHVDERGAAFFCLGYARATGRPAAWLTTSGTAAANGLPAVVEASMDAVPMVLLTADRPDELRGTGANQTIVQPGLFGVYPRLAEDLPAAGDHGAGPDLARAAAARAMGAATARPNGPVHLNIPFRKPLEPTALPVTHQFQNRWENALPAAGDDPTRGSSRKGQNGSGEGAPHSVDPDVLSDLARALEGPQRGVVLAGRMDTLEAAACSRLAETLGWPLLPDIASQLRLGTRGCRAISYADLLAGHLPTPDVVLQVGRMPVSQRLTRFLAAGRPRVWAVLADGTDRIDPHGCVTHRLSGARQACHALAGAADTGPGASFIEAWEQAEAVLRARLPVALSASGLTEPAVAALVAEHLPRDHGLVLASSMPVRDMNSFAGSGQRPSIVAVNRGASGIDGTLSTAAGVSEGLRSPVTLVIGDLAFLHDLNGLALVRDRPVTVVLINNDGGGIFSFLPVAEHTDLFEPYFGVPHGLTFGSAAGLYGIDYHAPSTPDDFVQAYRRAVASGGPTLLEVRTNRAANRAEHARLADLVGEWLASGK